MDDNTAKVILECFALIAGPVGLGVIQYFNRKEDVKKAEQTALQLAYEVKLAAEKVAAQATQHTAAIRSDLAMNTQITKDIHEQVIDAAPATSTTTNTLVVMPATPASEKDTETPNPKDVILKP